MRRSFDTYTAPKKEIPCRVMALIHDDAVRATR
jgi:hypothetical protein